MANYFSKGKISPRWVDNVFFIHEGVMAVFQSVSFMAKDAPFLSILIDFTGH